LKQISKLSTASKAQRRADKKRKKDAGAAEDEAVDEADFDVLGFSNAAESVSRRNNDDDDIDDDGGATSATTAPRYTAAEMAERNQRTLFVGNVSTSSKAKHLKKLFAPYGTVESVRFRSVAFENAGMPRKVAFRKHALHPERKSMNAC
jgi:nucleolar protein 12